MPKAQTLVVEEVILGNGCQAPGRPLRLNSKAGPAQTVEAGVSPMVDGKGSVWGAVVVLRNVEGNP